MAYKIGSLVRVKYVKHAANRCLVGRVGRVIEATDFAGIVTVYELDIQAPSNSPGIGYLHDQLEPAVPDGHRAGESGLCEPLDTLLEGLTRPCKGEV